MGRVERHLGIVMQVLGMLRALQPRLYSISSSMLEHEQRVQITVAAVRYSCLGRDRTGVASVQLADRLKVRGLQ